MNYKLLFYNRSPYHFKSNERMLTWKSVSYSFTSCFSFSQQVVGTCKIKILKTSLFVVFYFQNGFLYINLPLEQHSMSEFQKKKRMRKLRVTKKVLDILHTWDSLTKMQQSLRFRFSDNFYLQLRQNGKMDTLSYMVRTKNAIHTLPPVTPNTD